jgi:hypothetical protein
MAVTRPRTLAAEVLHNAAIAVLTLATVWAAAALISLVWR